MPELTRRQFFSSFGGAALLPAVTVSATSPSYSDSFEYKGIPILWSGWRQPTNQDTWIGWWMASVLKDFYGRDILCSTVTGQIHRTRELEIVQLTYKPDWPILTAHSTLSEREAVKQRAVSALIEFLNA